MGMAVIFRWLSPPGNWLADYILDPSLNTCRLLYLVIPGYADGGDSSTKLARPIPDWGFFSLITTNCAALAVALLAVSRDLIC